MTARRERAGDETANGIRTDCIARLRSRVAIPRDDDREKRPDKNAEPIHKRRARENPERSRQCADALEKRGHELLHDSQVEPARKEDITPVCTRPYAAESPATSSIGN